MKLYTNSVIDTVVIITLWETNFIPNKCAWNTARHL